MALAKGDACTGCAACWASCPVNAIAMEYDSEGFLYPVIGENCTRCGKCVEICRATKVVPTAGGRAFALQSSDERLRRTCSSGGAFALLAGDVLRRGGCVVAAGFDGAYLLRHAAVDSPDGLGALCGSKYLQSDVRDAYGALALCRRQRREALFCGTPCQIRGLLAHFGQRPEGMLLVDLVCYGVPSPKFFQAYIEDIARAHGAHPENFRFRDKRLANNGQTVSYALNGREILTNMLDDFFMRTMFKNLTLRPCCYVCADCSPARASDITLGDFHGIEAVRSDFADGLGTSLALVHTQRGQAALDAIAQDARMFECPVDSCQQPRLQSPSPKPLLRRFFFRDFRWDGARAVCDMDMLRKKYGA